MYCKCLRFGEVCRHVKQKHLFLLALVTARRTVSIRLSLHPLPSSFFDSFLSVMATGVDTLKKKKKQLIHSSVSVLSDQELLCFRLVQLLLEKNCQSWACSRLTDHVTDQ